MTEYNNFVKHFEILFYASRNKYSTGKPLRNKIHVRPLKYTENKI